jgi:phosphoribosylglycinamide formyltransferase-1
MTATVAILISGRGSNMLAIADNCMTGMLDARISFVASDEPAAKGLEEAAKLGMDTRILPYRESGKEMSEEILQGLLEESGSGLIVLAGFMRILSAGFVSRWRERIINIHPSLLPSFPGTDPIRRAWDHGVKITGVTVHVVDEMVDHGRILAQEPVRIMPEMTLEELEDKIHRTEHILYTRTLRDFLAGIYPASVRQEGI